MLWGTVACAFRAFKSQVCSSVALYLFVLTLSGDSTRVLWETQGVTAISRNRVLIILTPENLSMEGLGDAMNVCSGDFQLQNLAQR